MSVGHVYCLLWSYFPCASEEAQKQIDNNAIQNFDLLTTSAFKIKKGLLRGNKYGISKEAQDHGKAKEALECATKRGYSTILERYEIDDQ